MSETAERAHLEAPTRARGPVGRRLAPIAIAFGALGAACSSQSVLVPDLKDRGSEAPRPSAWSCWTEAGDPVGTPPVPGRDDRLRTDGSRDLADGARVGLPGATW